MPTAISCGGVVAGEPAPDVRGFAFILVLGIVVDDAIIVGENIHRHQELHGDGLRGAVDGAREIGKPVVFAVLTTAVAFLPLLFVTGAFGQMFQVVPLVVASVDRSNPNGMDALVPDARPWGR